MRDTLYYVGIFYPSGQLVARVSKHRSKAEAEAKASNLSSQYCTLKVAAYIDRKHPKVIYSPK